MLSACVSLYYFISLLASHDPNTETSPPLPSFCRRACLCCFGLLSGCLRALFLFAVLLPPLSLLPEPACF
jgi:hypothetical protein